MAKYFNQSDIDEFRDCFSLFAKDKVITSIDELTTITRSLGYSPTVQELKKYYSENAKDGKIDFATFLEILHIHSQKEKCQQEILAAFRAHDQEGSGTVPGAELMHILTQFAEKISPAEADRMFKEANANSRGAVRYEELMRIILTPLPDF